MVHCFQSINYYVPAEAPPPLTAAEIEAGALPPPASNKREAVKKILVVTDQTAFICDLKGTVNDAIQVDAIRVIDNYEAKSSNFLAICGDPTQDGYDHLIEFHNVGQTRGEERKRLVLLALRKVYDRVKTRDTGGNLVTNMEERLPDDKPYNLYRNPPRTPQVAQQRTVKHLRVAMENYDRQEEEKLKWVEALQTELEQEHEERLSDKDAVIRQLEQQLQEERSVQDIQNDEIKRLNQLHRLALGEDETVDVEGLDDKDKKIVEMQKNIRALQEREARLQERLGREKMGGNFFQLDIDQEVAKNKSRPRGGSLSVQGLTEVLTRQLQDREDDIQEMSEQLETLEKTRGELKKKDALIAALRAQAGAAGSVPVAEDFYDQRPRDAGVLHEPGSFDTNNYDAGNFASRAPIGGGGSYYPYQPEEPAQIPYEHHQPQQAHQQAPPYQRQPFVPKVPELPEQMQHHPISGLPLVDVPHEYRPNFPALCEKGKGVVMHMFETIQKRDRKGSSEERLLLVTDSNLYRCKTTGIINRCTGIDQIAELIVDGRSVGIKMQAVDNSEHDMLYDFTTPARAKEFVRIVQTVQEKMRKGKTLRAQVVHQPNPGARLNFDRPKNYKFVLREVMLKERLHKMWQLLEQENRRRHETEQDRLAAEHAQQAAYFDAAGGFDDGFGQDYGQDDGGGGYDEGYGGGGGYGDVQFNPQDAQTRHAMEALKGELRKEFQKKKDEEYQHLRLEIAKLEKEFEAKEKELSEAKSQWKGHRCYREKRPNIQSRPNEGMYWIPTEPTIIECQLEVLRVQFWDNILITSHANGFLNVFDIDTAELIRTLKDHTAKVVAFQYDGVELISGSYDSTIRRWNVTDGTCLNVITAHRGQVTCLQFDRNILVSGSSDSVIQVWQMDVELRRLKTLRGHKNAVQALRFQRDTLVSAESGWLFLWNLEQGIVVKAFRDEQGGITSLDFSDQWILTGGLSGALTMWDMNGEFETVHGHTDDVTHVQLEGPYAVTSSADCTVRMWDLVNFKSLGVFNNSYPNETTHFQFIANRFVAVEQRTIKVWTK